MSETLATVPVEVESRKSFVLRQLFSLSGVVPLGVFLVVHLWTMARALGGQGEFDDAVTATEHTPYATAFEAVFLWLPLLFHAGYGLKLSFDGRWNVGRYSYSRNWMYVLQRVTGVAALAFVAWHFYELRLPVLLGRADRVDLFPQLCASLSSTVAAGIPLHAILYLLGVGATVFHLANGLWGFCLSWGITVSRRAQRTSAVVFGLLGLVLFFVGANTLIYFATGAQLRLPGMPETRSEAVSCTDLGD